MVDRTISAHSVGNYSLHPELRLTAYKQAKTVAFNFY